MAFMIEQKWVESRETKAENKGRPVKIYKLALPISEIMDIIEKEKKEEATNQLNLIRKLRDYIS
jgi:predicted transcriptional regulator